MIYFTKKPKLRWPLIAWLVVGIYQTGALAQTDGGTLAPNGAITNTTCQLLIGDLNGTSFSPTSRVFNLGNGTSFAGNLSQAVGSAFSSQSFMQFAIANPGATAPDATNGCTSLGSGSWNVSLTLTADQIFTKSDGSTAVKNFLTPAQGGTDAVVNVYGFSQPTSAGAAPTNISQFTFMTLTSTRGLEGNLVSPSGAAAVTKNGRIWLGFQLARAFNSGSTTTGAFSASIPLTLVYK